MRRSEWLLWLMLVAMPGWSAQLQLESVLGGRVDDGFARADGPREFVFPDDSGPHEQFRSEWWYLTASLRNARGAEYGVQFTVFRQASTAADATDDPWTTGQFYLGHFAVTDVESRRHRVAQRAARGHPRLAGARAQPFGVWVDGWSLTAANADSGRFRLAASTTAMAAELELVPSKPRVLQGAEGLSVKGPGQASYYYSLPRLEVSGELVLDGDRQRVDGLGWFDREWSTSVLSEQQIGWDWFGLHLDSGEDLMAFRLRRADGQRDRHDHGSWVTTDGRARILEAARFDLQPLRYWQDAGGTRWPLEWSVTVRLAEGERDYRVVAALEDQRMETLLTYWEGLVRVLDEQGRQVGSGYMELTGYE